MREEIFWTVQCQIDTYNLFQHLAFISQRQWTDATVSPIVRTQWRMIGVEGCKVQSVHHASNAPVYFVWVFFHACMSSSLKAPSLYTWLLALNIITWTYCRICWDLHVEFSWFAQQLQAFVWFDVCLRPPNPQQHSLLSVHVELGARLRHMGRQLGVTKLHLERQQNQVQGTIHDMWRWIKSPGHILRATDSSFFCYVSAHIYTLPKAFVRKHASGRTTAQTKTRVVPQPSQGNLQGRMMCPNLQ